MAETVYLSISCSFFNFKMLLHIIDCRFYVNKLLVESHLCNISRVSINR